MGEIFTSAVRVILPVRDDSGELVAESTIANAETEVKIFSSFGKEGAYIEVCLYVMDPTTLLYSTPCLGDPFAVQIDGSGIETNWAVSDVRFEEPDGAGKEWCLRITGEAPFYRALCHCTVTGTIDLGKSIGFRQAMGRVVRKALEDNGILEGFKNFRIFCNSKGVNKTYSSIFCFNETAADVIDEMAAELGLEYYYSPFEDAMYVGRPSPSNEELDMERFDELAQSGKHMSYGLFKEEGIVEVVDAVVPGSSMLIPGSLAKIGGELWKVIKGSYYANGQGERENHVKIVKASVVCDYIFLATINDQPLPQTHVQVGDVIKIGDVIPRSGNARDSSHGKYEANFIPSDSSKQDQGAWDFLDKNRMYPLTRTTPYAGNGVGMLFPKVDKSRAMIFSPNTHRAHGLIGPMMWKEGKSPDTVPRCNDDDLLLRLKDGELYFDAANKTWLLRASKIVFDGADPAAATSTPSTSPGSAYLKIESSGTITVEGTTIKLGAGNTKFVALADHTHTITTTATISVGSVGTCTCGAPDSVSTKAKAE